MPDGASSVRVQFSRLTRKSSHALVLQQGAKGHVLLSNNSFRETNLFVQFEVLRIVNVLFVDIHSMLSEIIRLSATQSNLEPEGLRELVSKLITFKYSNDVENGKRYTLTLQELLSYGCYCQFDDDINYRHRHGIPLDELDLHCQNFKRCSSCVTIDDETCQDTHANFAYIYNEATGLYECASGSECQKNMCSCATDFVNNIFEKTEFAVRGLSRQHNLEVMKLCQPGHRQLRARIAAPLSGENDACCGIYPKRFPFKTTDKDKICCDGKIINKQRTICEENSTLSDEDKIFLYDESKDATPDDSMITSATSKYETVFETYTVTSTTGTSVSYNTATETGVTSLMENKNKEEYETFFYTTTSSDDTTATTTMTSTTFRGFDGPCSPNPCFNDGECVESANPEYPWLAYSCICPTAPIVFTGRNCQYGPCNPNPCINGGKCEIADSKRSEYENIKCSCPTGFAGSFCEQQLL